MDEEIQFGEMEVERPGTRRRPDRDRHFAVVPYDDPDETELPVFLDLDTLMEIEAHAHEDKSVELGGVLLGGQYEDEEGKPFVLVTDSVRARDYESSRGHFKFTHETWTKIGQEQQAFSDELKMVGWYHTHPGWGVFLSGMDTFICDHFFNRPLDVALVVDPLRLDWGFFYWGPDPADRLPRCRGFYVISSRHRQRFLKRFVDQLQHERDGFPEGPRTESGELSPQRQPLTADEPYEPMDSWRELTMQRSNVSPFLLLGTSLLLILFLQTAGIFYFIGSAPTATALPPTNASPKEERSLVSAQEKLETLLKREQALEVKTRMLDRIIEQVQDGPEDLASEYIEMKGSNDAFQKMIAQQSQAWAALNQQHEEVLAENVTLISERDTLEKEVETFKDQRDASSKENFDLKKELADLKLTHGQNTWGSVWTYLATSGGAFLLALCLSGGLFWWRSRSPSSASYDDPVTITDEEPLDSEEKNQSTELGIENQENWR
ncbi:Hypothetical protein PBC10988_10340 [Planctomycetales bacterium 10988]|nr:Hypothetical protein PBC10988_10340 [Planctomycetales bacterium 10988]